LLGRHFRRKGDQEATLRIALVPVQTAFGRSCVETLLGAPWWLGLLRPECRDAIVATSLHLPKLRLLKAASATTDPMQQISAQGSAVAVD
jgi:hypothetical protein